MEYGYSILYWVTLTIEVIRTYAGQDWSHLSRNINNGIIQVTLKWIKKYEGSRIVWKCLDKIVLDKCNIVFNIKLASSNACWRKHWILSDSQTIKFNIIPSIYTIIHRLLSTHFLIMNSLKPPYSLSKVITMGLQTTSYKVNCLDLYGSFLVVEIQYLHFVTLISFRRNQIGIYLAIITQYNEILVRHVFAEVTFNIGYKCRVA